MTRILEQQSQYNLMNQKQLDEALLHACIDNDLELIRYLLISPELNMHANIHMRDDVVLTIVCGLGYVPLTKYLLTASELPEHVNIHSNKENAFLCACDEGRLDVVHYLLTSPDLTEHANIHYNDDEAFKVTCRSKHIDLIKYLVFDYQINKTEFIEQYLIDNKREDIINMFNKRKLENRLQDELKTLQIINKVKL